MAKSSGKHGKKLEDKRRHVTCYLAASVSLITFMVYLASLRNDIVIWDDDTYCCLEMISLRCWSAS